ncbi:unnamed protein product [Linum tenue]|uniref:AP2/ERF domain-containing protein n=1 Tax=Linum tenue TaxID=586396 RepID=A0AAV0Q0J3_9ROSI|nr:unnamed protein product [Linum tenue]
MDRAVFGSTQQLHYSQRQSSYDSSSSASNGSGTTSSDNQQHQLAAEVPKKRTGRRVFRETRHPVYRGVRSRKGDKWVCELREPTTGTRVWLGTHATAEMAARAHDVAALAYRGKSACLNFADSAWRLPVPASTDQLDVRRAAAEAAAIQQLQQSSESSSSSPSGTTLPGNQQHQLAAEVPKKRTGRRVFRETRHPVYRGVRSRKGSKWVCELREPNTGTRVWLGTHATPEMAARAHDVAALAYRGKSACLNFADSAWRLPVPASADQEDIRRAAAEAAEMFRPGGPATPAEQEEECKDNGDDIDSSNDTNIVLRKVEAEEELEMPRLLSEMAEGPLLSPPPSYGYGGGRGGVEESCDCDANGGYDWTLWNH